MTSSALLLDLDGTLVNSIDLYERAVLEAFAKHGMEISHEQFHDWYMRPWHLSQILAYFGKSEDDAPAIREERDRLYEELLRNDISWLDGAEEFLRAAKKRYPLAIVTGSWMSYVDAIDEKLNIRQYVQTIITVDDTGHLMKPHPHGLFLAADRLGVAPEKCLYIGDQKFDVDAATAAGMPCILFDGPWTPEGAGEGAMKTVTSLAEIATILL